MRDYAKICPQFWTGQTARLLRGNYKAHLAAGYLFSGPQSNMIGLYYLPLTTFAHETGIPISEVPAVLQALMNLDFCKYDKRGELIWVCEAAKYQIAARLDPTDKRVKGIRRLLQLYKNSPLSHYFHLKYRAVFHLGETSPFEGPSEALRSQEQEQEQEQEQKQEQFRIQEQGFFSEEKSIVGREKKSPSAVNGFVGQAEEVLTFLNQKTGHQFRFRENGRGKLSVNAERIVSRLKSGASVDDCKSVIAKKVRDWKGDPKSEQWLRPSTLFRKENFEQYLGTIHKTATAQSPGLNRAERRIQEEMGLRK